MGHLIFFYYILSLCAGGAALLISFSVYLNMKEKFIKEYLLFFSIFGIKIAEISIMFYVFFNLNNNIKAVENSYTFCAVVTFIFYTSMLTLINESFDVPHKKIKNYLIFAITLILMGVGLFSYEIDIKKELFYITDSFYAVTAYTVAAILYVIYNGIKYSKNIEDRLHKSINSGVVKLFVLFSPLTIADSLKISGGRVFKLGNEFSLYYFLPALFALFSIWFAAKLLNAEAEAAAGDDTIEEEELYYIESINEESCEKYKISAREKEVIINLLNGKCNKEIADEMGISINTVKSYLNNIYGKFGVRSRKEIFNIVNPKNNL